MGFAIFIGTFFLAGKLLSLLGLDQHKKGIRLVLTNEKIEIRRPQAKDSEIYDNHELKFHGTERMLLSIEDRNGKTFLVPELVELKNLRKHRDVGISEGILALQVIDGKLRLVIRPLNEFGERKVVAF
jgi:hypothetical protein